MHLLYVLYLFIVHGFASAVYDVVEGERLDTVFRINVKGTSIFEIALPGVVTSMAGGTTSEYT